MSTWTISILVSGVPGTRSVHGVCYLQFQPWAVPAPSVAFASCSNEAQELNHSEDKPSQHRGRGSRRIQQVGALPGKLAVGEAHEGSGGEEAGAWQPSGTDVLIIPRFPTQSLSFHFCKKGTVIAVAASEGVLRINWDNIHKGALHSKWFKQGDGMWQGGALWSRAVLWRQALSLTSCVILKELLTLSVLHFPHL